MAVVTFAINELGVAHLGGYANRCGDSAGVASASGSGSCACCSRTVGAAAAAFSPATIAAAAPPPPPPPTPSAAIAACLSCSSLMNALARLPKGLCLNMASSTWLSVALSCPTLYTSLTGGTV